MGLLSLVPISTRQPCSSVGENRELGARENRGLEWYERGGEETARGGSSKRAGSGRHYVTTLDSILQSKRAKGRTRESQECTAWKA